MLEHWANKCSIKSYYCLFCNAVSKYFVKDFINIPNLLVGELISSKIDWNGGQLFTLSPRTVEVAYIKPGLVPTGFEDLLSYC